MANPKGTQGMTIPQSTYNKLSNLKKDSETFDTVIKKLVEMDLKYNPQPETKEYEYITDTTSKLFKVTFEKHNHTIIYCGKTSESKFISEWEDYPPISKEDKDNFIDFIFGEGNMNILYNLEGSISYPEFDIRRIS